MSTLGDSPPLASPDASTDAQWKQWALAVFGGNEPRATAAAQAAAVARRAGATGDAVFAAARAAYDTAGSPSGAHASAPSSRPRPSDPRLHCASKWPWAPGVSRLIRAGIGSVIARNGGSSVYQ